MIPILRISKKLRDNEEFILFPYEEEFGCITIKIVKYHPLQAFNMQKKIVLKGADNDFDEYRLIKVVESVLHMVRRDHDHWVNSSLKFLDYPSLQEPKKLSEEQKNAIKEVTERISKILTSDIDEDDVRWAESLIKERENENAEQKMKESYYCTDCGALIEEDCICNPGGDSHVFICDSCGFCHSYQPDVCQRDNCNSRFFSIQGS